jgi:hypothetical protein
MRSSLLWMYGGYVPPGLMNLTGLRLIALTMLEADT